MKICEELNKEKGKTKKQKKKQKNRIISENRKNAWS